MAESTEGDNRSDCWQAIRRPFNSFRYSVISCAKRRVLPELRVRLPFRFARMPAWLFIRAVVTRDARFLGVTLLSCTVASIVAAFQWSVYTSFVRTGAVAPQWLGGDIWISARTVQCFDFPDPIAEDYSALAARDLPGVSFRRVAFGFVTWRSPSGRQGNVALIGVDGLALPDNGFIVDASDVERLDLEGDAGDIENRLATIGGETMVHYGTVDTLPTFLGAPYVVANFIRARELLRMDPASTAFLIGDAGGRTPDLEAASAKLADRFPDIALHSAEEFANQSSSYWQNKTGAGMAILLAAILAGLLMAILLINGVLRFIQRYHYDLISLLGHGASQRDIRIIVGGIAALIAGATSALGLMATPLIIWAVQPILPWTMFYFTDAVVPLAGIMTALLLATLASRRAIAAYGPEAVFRT